MAFNSPVWFNVGVEEQPAVLRACFINSVDDSIELDPRSGEDRRHALQVRASGYGLEPCPSLRRLRREHLNGGGLTRVGSGLVHARLRWPSRGATQGRRQDRVRARAKMVILKHRSTPDVVDFIDCKAIEREEGRGADSIAGYDGRAFNVQGGEAYGLGGTTKNANPLGPRPGRVS